MLVCILRKLHFFLLDVISHVNTAKIKYASCELSSCEKTVFQYFIFGNNNIHTNVLLNGEQHVNIWLLMKMQTGQ